MHKKMAAVVSHLKSHEHGSVEHISHCLPLTGERWKDECVMKDYK